MTNLLLNWSLVYITLFIIIWSINKLYSKYTLLNKYKSYLDLLDHFLNVAYQIIYKDQIVPFSSNAVTPQSDELETAKRNYVKLVFEIMGKSLTNTLIEFYGSREVLIRNMLTYFQNKLDDDEIMKFLNTKKESDKE